MFFFFFFFNFNLSFFFFFAIFFSFFFFKLSFFIYKSSFFFNKKKTYHVYECSYDQMNTSKNFYSLLFFIVALSFMLFDMEIVLLLPYIYVFFFNSISLKVFSIFLMILMLSLLYEIYSKVFK